jgi:hypothetical protein
VDGSRIRKPDKSNPGGYRQRGTGLPERSAGMASGSDTCELEIALAARSGGGGGSPAPPLKLLVAPEAHWTRLLSTKIVQLLVQSAGSELVSVTQGVLGFKVGRHCTM